MIGTGNERIQTPGMSAEVKIGGVVGALIMAGVYYILFAANDNMPGGPDDGDEDSFWKKFFNPDWWKPG